MPWPIRLYGCRSTSDVFVDYFPLYLLRQCFSLNQKLINWLDWLVKETLDKPLALPSQHWDFKNVSVGNGVQALILDQQVYSTH